MIRLGFQDRMCDLVLISLLTPGSGSKCACSGMSKVHSVLSSAPAMAIRCGCLHGERAREKTHGFMMGHQTMALNVCEDHAGCSKLAHPCDCMPTTSSARPVRFTLACKVFLVVVIRGIGVVDKHARNKAAIISWGSHGQ